MGGLMAHSSRLLSLLGEKQKEGTAHSPLQPNFAASGEAQKLLLPLI